MVKTRNLLKMVKRITKVVKTRNLLKMVKRIRKVVKTRNMLMKMVKTLFTNAKALNHPQS
jgi:hypothetical protein